MAIHPSAHVDARAEIDSGADIGPFAVIDGPVRIGAGTRVMAHAVITGHTRLGRDNVVHYGAVIGDEPQDLAYAGAPSEVHIGDRNVFREHVYVHRATQASAATVIGNGNYLMGHSHVAHNCRLGDAIILASGAVLGGHVQVDDGAFISGNCVVHQHVRVGRLALMRGLSRASRDVPPFALMDFTHTVRGVNLVGLRRAGFSSQRIRAVRNAFKHLFGERRNLRQALAELETQEVGDDVRELVDFIRASKRGVCFGMRSGPREDEE
jgi:UDP-N-acetylglucosamine acyltransferase